MTVSDWYGRAGCTAAVVLCLGACSGASTTSIGGDPDGSTSEGGGTGVDSGPVTSSDSGPQSRRDGAVAGDGGQEAAMGSDAPGHPSGDSAAVDASTGVPIQCGK